MASKSSSIGEIIKLTRPDNVETLRSTIIGKNLSMPLPNKLSPLQYACWLDNEDAIKILLEDQSLTQENIKLAFLYSVQKKNFQIAALILSKVSLLTYNDVGLIRFVFEHVSDPEAINLMIQQMLSLFSDNKNIFLLVAMDMDSEPWTSYLLKYIQNLSDSENHYNVSPFIYACSRQSDVLFNLIYKNVITTLDEPSTVQGIMITIQKRSLHHMLILLDLYFKSFSTKKSDLHILVNIIFTDVDMLIKSEELLQYFKLYADDMLSYIYSYYEEDMDVDVETIIKLLTDLEKNGVKFNYLVPHTISGQPLLFHIVTKGLVKETKIIRDQVADTSILIDVSIPRITLQVPREPKIEKMKDTIEDDFVTYGVSRNRRKLNTYGRRRNMSDGSDHSYGDDRDEGGYDGYDDFDDMILIDCSDVAKNPLVEYHLQKTNNQIDPVLLNGRPLSEHYINLMIENISGVRAYRMLSSSRELKFVNDQYLNLLFLNNSEPVLRNKSAKSYIDMITNIIKTKLLEQILTSNEGSVAVSAIRTFVSYGYDVNLIYGDVLPYILKDVRLLKTFINWGLHIHDDILSHVLNFKPDQYPVIIELLKCGVQVNSDSFDAMLKLLEDNAHLSTPLTSDNSEIQADIIMIKDYLVANNVELGRMLYEDSPNLQVSSINYAKDIDLLSDNNKSLGLIHCHGSIVTDKYIVLPDTIGIYVLAPRGEVTTSTASSTRKMLTQQGREESLQRSYVRYYQPGSVMQEQNLQFFPNDDEYIPMNVDEQDETDPFTDHYVEKRDVNCKKIVNRESFRSYGIILSGDYDRQWSERLNKTTHDNVDRVVVDDNNKIIKSFVTANIDYVSVRDDILRCNNDGFFSKTELWNLIDPKQRTLSSIIQRAMDRKISCNFVLSSCRSGDIWGTDLHLQACRSLYKKYNKQDSDLESQQISREQMKIVRQDSRFFSSSSFYSDVINFCEKYVETDLPIILDDNNKVMWGSTMFDVRTSIMNRYKTDKMFNKEQRYAIYTKDRSQQTIREINPAWYGHFEKKIKKFLDIFVKNITDRVKNNVTIHTVEYCCMYALIHDHNIPYISSMAIECMVNKDMYLQICMMK